MLASLAAQTRLPDQVVIVDQDGSSRALAREFSKLDVTVIVLPGSASSKRNVGFKAVRPEITLIGFMDDDIVLEATAIELTERFWRNAPPGLGGTSCAYANAPSAFGRGVKKPRLLSALGIYGHEPGCVARSGFQTWVGDSDAVTFVRWLPAGAAFYTSRVLNEFAFDEWFSGYSYLEDLEFSYRIGKKYGLAVVPGARFHHYPSKVGRPDWRSFGSKEVVNRLYFVGKNPELSEPLCCLALSIRALMSMFLGVRELEPGYFKRVAGNLAGFAKAARRRFAPPCEE
jgi:GT2 family glycosyltransferase